MPRRGGRHSRTPRDYGVPDPYAGPDPDAQPAPGRDAQADPYATAGRYDQAGPSAPPGSYGAPAPYGQPGPFPPASPGSPAWPYGGQESRGAHAARDGQAGSYGPAARDGQAGSYGPAARDGQAGPYGPAARDGQAGPYGRPGYAGPPLSGRHSLPGRDPGPARDPLPGRDPLAPSDPRYGRPSPGIPGPYPPQGFTPPAPGPRTDAYGRPGPHLNGAQGQGRRPYQGGPAGYGQPNGYGRAGSRGQAAGGRAPDYPPGESNGRGGFGDERGAHGPAPLSGPEDHGPFRWRPSPDAGPREAPPAAAHRGGNDPARPGSGDWDPGPAPGPPAVRRESQDFSGPSAPEPGPGPAGGEEWPYGGGEPQEWDEPGGDALIPGFGERRDARRGRGGRPGRRVGRAVAPVLAPVIALVVLAALALGGYKIYQKFHSPDYSGAGFGQVTVEVFPGDTAESLAPRLVSLGVVASTGSFVSAVKHSSDPTGLQPGFFRLHKHMKAALAYRLLLDPASRIQTVVTIPEGLRLTQILSLLGARSAISASAYAKAVKDTAALGLPSYAKGNPEGYLFPATYDINPGMSATSVLQAMVARFGQEAASISLPQAAAADHLTPGQVITVASLLQAEAGNVKYFPLVAEVIYNRLNAHWDLGLQSTVDYILHTNKASLTVTQLHVASPYNTYIHPGLPPGPIDSPGDAAIQAALHPAHGNYMYFVTVDLKTGLTKFTSSATVFRELEAECQRNGAC